MLALVVTPVACLLSVMLVCVGLRCDVVPAYVCGYLSLLLLLPGWGFSLAPNTACLLPC